MYTGIIQACLPIHSLEPHVGLLSYAIEFTDELLDGLQLGASVSIDGTCQTVVAIKNRCVYFDAIAETLSITTLGKLQPGQYVNIERSSKIGDENGGHAISGHVHACAEIIDIQQPENNHIITLKAPKTWMKYFFAKGFIALNGASLTLLNVSQSEQSFSVSLIPETLKRTNFQQKKIGDKINFEIETQTRITVDTVENFLENNLNTLTKGINNAT